MGKSEGSPVILIRGYRYKPSSEPAASIIRPAAEDLFPLIPFFSAASALSVHSVLNSFCTLGSSQNA